MRKNKCKKYRKVFVEALYNELPAAGRESFQAHLNECQGCASEYAKMVSVLGIMDERKRPEIKEEYWDSYWTRLEERIDIEHRGIKDKIKLDRLWKWAGGFHFKIGRVLYPAAAVLLLAIGIFVGKIIYSPSSSPLKETGMIDRAAVSNNLIFSAAARHFENLRPLLVECSNFTTGESMAGEEAIPVEEKTIKKLVFQHYLLKKAVAKSDNIFLKQLVDELELILLEISNSNGQKTQAIEAVQEILKEDDILFKMKVYTNKGKRSLKI